jgi:UDP-glucose 4-epimerase
MILVTGGFGFIGSHVIRALHEQGQQVVALQRRATDVPAHLADVPVLVEQADVADRDALRAVAGRHDLDGVIHLAGYPAPRGAADFRDGLNLVRGWFDGMLNIAHLASENAIRRVTLASTIGVYAGTQHQGPMTEDAPVLLSSPHPIPRSKKVSELLAQQFNESTGIDFVNLRISGTWGPLGHEDPFFAAPALAHAAATGQPLDTSSMAAQPHLEDGLDLCYVKDTARAIVGVQLADSLSHSTYNIASGATSTNRDIIAAIRTVVPNAELELPDGGSASNPLDISRLRDDIGYAPEYNLEAAAEDYIQWLRAGNTR